jgi:uncharacterized protein YigE (DUF2233 family)
MRIGKSIFLIGLVLLALLGLSLSCLQALSEDERILSYIVDPASQQVKLYWRDDSSRVFKSILNLKKWLESKDETLEFAMNGGMYKPDNSPQGLFIQDKKTLAALDTSSGNGNFYLKPNGVFYITTDRKAVVCQTSNFNDDGTIEYATQSGPMLVIDGNIHPVFKKGSNNLNIRNGVGILPDNKIIFAMSKSEINLHDFAAYFKQLGCQNALYLDGFVSRAYLPQKNWVQTDGNFGVIIGVTKKTGNGG